MVQNSGLTQDASEYTPTLTAMVESSARSVGKLVVKKRGRVYLAELN
jgi:hypothetical protein